MKVVRGPGQKLLITLTHVLISSFQMNMYRRFSVSASKIVGTHNGSFHCDEALACFIHRQIHMLAAVKVIRNRDHQLLEALDVVVDVGGVYDPTRDRFDHHQKGFDQVFGHGFTTKLSSAGLVYKHYGAELISRELQLDRGHPDVHRLCLAVYKNFIESIRFHAKSWLPARSIVMEFLAARNDVDSSGEIMVLTRSCPWKLHIFEIEEEMKIDPSVKYVNYQDDRSGNWRLQAVAVSPDKFEGRKPLPVLWRGLEGEELSNVAGIPSCVFVHMSGFIGGNRSYYGAIAMARAALKT